jgi:hypothetical protein
MCPPCVNQVKHCASLAVTLIAKAVTGVVTRSCTRVSTKGGCPATLSW